MLTSRALVLARAASVGLKAKLGAGQANQLVRHSHQWNYRCGPTNHSKSTLIGAELVGGFMWWWILWHLWHEPEHIYGHYTYIEPSSWTNAELGIPADDVE